MGNSKSKMLNKPTTIETLTKLHTCHDRLEKKETHIYKKILQILKEANLKIKQNDKKSAIKLLRKKKLYERECNKLKGMKFTIQQQIINLEGMEINNQVVAAMTDGAKTMKSMTSDICIEKVEELQDNIEEHQQTVNEISDLLAQSVDDDDEFEEELNDIMNKNLTEKLLTINLPQVPTTKVQTQTQDEEDELKQLELEMAM